MKEMKDSEELAMSESKIVQSSIEQVDLSIPECEECAVKFEERALNTVQTSEDVETSIESKAVPQSEVIEIDTPVVDQAASIEAKLMIDTPDEKVTAVASTQKEVTTDLEKSLKMNTEVTNSMQNQVEKPTGLDLSEISYPTNDKIASVENTSNETSVELFANSLTENEGLQKFVVDELNAAESAVAESLNAAEKIAEEVIDHKTEASGGSAGRAFETAIIDSIDASDAVAEAVTNGAKAEALAVRDLKAVS